MSWLLVGAIAAVWIATFAGFALWLSSLFAFAASDGCTCTRYRIDHRCPKHGWGVLS